MSKTETLNDYKKRRIKYLRQCGIKINENDEKLIYLRTNQTQVDNTCRTLMFR